LAWQVNAIARGRDITRAAASRQLNERYGAAMGMAAP
jgi:hypothetical protein